MRTSRRKAAAQVKNSDFVHDESGVGDHTRPGSPAAQSSPEMREAMIRNAAYSHYERRGLAEGQQLDDWLKAEMEVDRQHSTAAVTQPAS
jgi:hypothetical protein